MNGHSDVLAGAVASSAAVIAKVGRRTQSFETGEMLSHLVTLRSRLA